MIKKVQGILNSEFGRKITVFSRNEMRVLKVRIRKLLPVFKELEINKSTIPRWIINNQEYFGAYLAGVIDGDGDILIKRPKYPQCRVRITSGEESLMLIELIKKHLMCSAWIEKYSGFVTLPSGKRVIPNAFRHCFYVSSKNILLFKEFVYPWIQIKHKKYILERFFKIN